MEIISGVHYPQNPFGYLTLFRQLKDDYIEEIPKEIMHSYFSKDIHGQIVHIYETPPKYKVRKIWFTAINSNTENVIADEYVSDKSKILFDQFYLYISKTDFLHRLTTKEDIEKGNELLASLINDLENLSSISHPQ